MKITSIFAAIALVTGLALSGIIYPTTCIVTEVNYDTDTVYMETATGIEYAFTGTEDWVEGDLCGCIMYNSCTPETILDDEIIVTRYVGYPEAFLERMP